MRLGDIIEVRKGKKPTTVVSELKPGYRRLIQIDDLRPNADKKFCPSAAGEVAAIETDVIIAWDGANAATSSFGLTGVIGSTLAILRPARAKMFTPYFGHFVQSNSRHLRERCKGATVPHIDGRVLKNLEIPLPPLAEQRRIAEVLDRAEALRAKRRAALAQLEVLTLSLFIDLFGDPVTNPKKWPRTPFSELLANIDSGWSPKCLDRPVTGEEWGILKLGAVTWCEYNPAENKALPPDVKPDPVIEVKAGDLLFARKNTYELVAACALVRETPPRLLMSDLIFRLRLRPDAKVDSCFLHQLLIYPTKRRDIQKLAGGSAGSMQIGRAHV